MFKNIRTASEIEQERLAHKRLCGWLPIETAPVDRFILLYCPEDGSRWLAKLQGGEWYGVDDDGLTRSAGYGGPASERVTGWRITHWQELPAIPQL